jgi:hypothetical protein
LLKGASSKKGGIMKWLWTALSTGLGIASAQAYTCADVRTLSVEQQAYYIRVFNITPAQQEHIRHACYEPKARQAMTSMEGSASHFGHGERDARIGQ